jgi:uncharacterized protein (TIGR02678 family)
MNATPTPVPSGPVSSAVPSAPRQATTSTAEEVSARLTFLGLLCQPLVTVDLDQLLFRAVVRHAKHIDTFCRRLGYRRTHHGGAIRLDRSPLLGTVTAPSRPPDFPTRRVLALTALLAAACEEVEGGVTLVKLSDLVAEISANTDRNIRPYDPDLLTERRCLVKAASTLEFWGLLRKRATLVTDVTEWTENRSGIGAGYDVNRDALLLFVNPETLAVAAHQQAQLEQAQLEQAEPQAATEAAGSPVPDPVSTAEDTRTGGTISTQDDPGADHDDSPAAIWAAQRRATRVVRHLRAVVETPALLYSDLDPDEVDLARSQRGLRAGEAIAMIGGTVEARSEGLVWVTREDECPATMVWPTAKTESWAALMTAHKAGRDGVRDSSGVVHLDSATVNDVLEDLTDWKGELFRRELREDPAGLRTAVEDTLRWVGLLKTTADGSWRLSPVAGRYRDPELIDPGPPPTEPGLFSLEDDTAPGTPDTDAPDTGASADPGHPDEELP